ncbi:hypothetical protein M3Y94_01056100 [Aphelenchoides besseyi]|nr:hypothetical protein M3Y94_01056100 [Aphelenchoides besseyi]KAI6224140.1 Nuclear receptor domain-containing protein [Aphelenchoides besseyi]
MHIRMSKQYSRDTPDAPPSVTSTEMDAEIDVVTVSPMNTRPCTSTAGVYSGRMTCLVCHSAAKRKHYGSEVCNACGSFFRRTVSNRRNYYCSKKNCILTEAGNKEGRLCKYCRFQRCVEVGMIIDSIFRRKLLAEEDQFRDCSLLQRIVRARQATFVNKINLMGKIAREYNTVAQMGSLKPSVQQTAMSKLSEFEVLLIFLKDSGFPEFGFTELDLARIAVRVYYRWLFLTAIAVTLRSGGHHTQTVYFSDRGHVPVSYDDCFEFFLSHRIGNLPVIAKSWYELFLRGMRIGQRFHEAHLDKTEFALLSQLLVLTEAREMFPTSKAVAQRLADLFQEMKDYHETSYSDVALRLGNVILLLNDINDMNPHIKQMAVLMEISGYGVVLPQIQKNYGFTNI